ncbi:MAG: Ldh family oxidoreductase [Anaerolineae bacterium]|nr:Ldh family oxidoreductase [Anaerolineae bacterium]
MTTRVDAQKLERLVSDLLVAVDVPREDADIVAWVLVKTDLRGVESHGTARLSYYYLDNTRVGLINRRPKVTVVAEGPSTLVIDADNGLGHPVAYRTMERCIDKARETGLCCATVRHSNHFGAAGIYAMMALEHDMIGLALTNSQPLAIPTYGRKRVLGTNPISLAAPAGEELAFVLDMATSVVPIGRIEVFRRAGAQVPLGWGADSEGHATTDPVRIMEGGGLFPLGGTAETGGYKGYGLAAMVDVLCGVLAGAAFLTGVQPPLLDRPGPANVGHFFLALNVAAFRPIEEFKASMDGFIRELKQSPKAAGEDRIYVAGEKEFLQEEERRRLGIPLNPKVEEDFRRLCRELDVPWPF